MEMPTFSSRSAPRRILKGRTNIGRLCELYQAHATKYGDMIEEMLPYIEQSAADDLRLPGDPTELGLLPVMQFTKLEISVSDFQQAPVCQIHRACCSGTKAFRNGGPSNDWAWVQTGRVQSYGDLRGLAVARLLAPCKIRNVLSEAAGVYRWALVQVLDPINGARFQLASGHIRVGKRSTGRDMRIFSIGALIGEAHVILSGEMQWIVNHRIDPRTFNDIY